LSDAIVALEMDPAVNGELLDKIKAQGDVVRKLKEQKAEKSKVIDLAPTFEPILRLRNLQLQRQRCSGLERFFIGAEENIFHFKTN
jgi:hypothetical protein